MLSQTHMTFFLPCNTHTHTQTEKKDILKNVLAALLHSVKVNEDLGCWTPKASYCTCCPDDLCVFIPNHTLILFKEQTKIKMLNKDLNKAILWFACCVFCSQICLVPWHQQCYDQSSLTNVLSQCSKFEQANVWMSTTFWSVLHTNLPHDFRRLESYGKLLYATLMVVCTGFSFTFIIWKRVVNALFSIPPFMFHRRKRVM